MRGFCRYFLRYTYTTAPAPIFFTAQNLRLAAPCIPGSRLAGLADGIRQICQEREEKAGTLLLQERAGQGR